LEESRRLLYVGMTRAKDRLVLTRVEARDGRPTGGRRFLDELRVDAASDRRSSMASRWTRARSRSVMTAGRMRS